MTFPLLSAFDRLRVRLGLGLVEYRALVEALAAGFGTGSRAELLAVCQALWAKTEDDRQLVAVEVAHELPPEFTPADEAKIRAGLEPGDLQRAAKNRKSTLDRPDPPKSRHTVDTADPGQDGPVGAVPLRPTIPDRFRPEPGVFDLIGKGPGLGRAFLREWRTYRRMSRAGVGAELDVSGTVARLVRDGVLVAPALLPARRNRVSLLLVIDQSRSMTPFRWQVAALLRAAGRAGFDRVTAAYSGNTPSDPLTRDPGRNEPVRVDPLLREAAADAVVFVGDAGAARGRRDDARADRTAGFVARVGRSGCRIGWINPVLDPKRWNQSTAGLVRDRTRVPMVELTGRGLRSLITRLRGRDV